MTRFMLGLLVACAVVSLFTGCGSAISATSSNGEVLEADGDYAYVRMKSKKDYASYNTFIQVYFGYPVRKEDEVILITQRYLDSLLVVTQKVIIQ